MSLWQGVCRLTGAASIVLCLLTMGCGKPLAANVPELHPVAGKVAKDGQPMTAGLVEFQPADDTGERANGEIVTLGEYLEHVWAAVSKEALTMIFEGADTTGFEEDARLTAAWLWTLSAGATNGEDGDKVVASTGYALEYDAARKISQGLGAHLEQLPNLVEVKGGTAVLLPVSQRARYLFGKEGIDGRRRIPQPDGPKQLSWLESLPVAEAAEWALPETGTTATGATTLDRIHQSMLLFAAGKSDALRRFLVDDGIGGDERFWRLAQALSALYPSHTDEKRWVDGVLARKKSLGF